MIIGGLDKDTKTSIPGESCIEVITFASVDANGIQYPHHDPIMVTLNIDKYNVHHIFVDSESSVDALFYGAFLKMNIPYNDWER